MIFLPVKEKLKKLLQTAACENAGGGSSFGHEKPDAVDVPVSGFGFAVRKEPVSAQPSDLFRYWIFISTSPAIPGILPYALCCQIAYSPS